MPLLNRRPVESRHLVELAGLFLKLGTIAFGGPAAHVAMMEDEVVRRRGWLSRQEFLDLWGATHLIPGPNSTELAIHIGHRRAGWPGLLVAGAAFILPASLIVTVIAWAYVRFGRLPDAQGVLAGVKPVILAVVVQALWSLGRSAVKTRGLAFTGLLATAAVLAGVHELVVLFAGGGLLALARAGVRSGLGSKASVLLAVGPGLPSWGAAGTTGLVATAGAAGVVPFGLGPLFLSFLKIGAVLYGSGYVLLAFLRADFVERCGWLTEAQLLDAVAVGQFTPGPVFTTATFIGFLLGGAPGAAVATVGIFLPAFVFVALSGPLIPRLRQSRVAGDVLDGVNVASLALMAVVTLQLGRVALAGWLPVALALASAVLLVRFRVNSAWLVLAGGVLGFLLLRS